jgi:ectoine hydroxylase-related dioxygenase (phytanoyl-CoA dioxygenase family)
MTANPLVRLTSPVTDAGFQVSPFHLTPDQVAFFDQNGYLVLRNWISGDLLERLQAAGSAWIQQGLDQQIREDFPTNQDYIFRETKGKPVMFRVDYLHDKGYPASLELLGSPQVLALAESLCGVNFVPTYESMVFKNEGDGAVIRWHQDAVHPRRWRIFNLDLYLDASRKGAGALHVIPGTQTQPQPFCNIEHDYGWDVPASIEVEMGAGDILLHDVMIAHGSPETHGSPLRRTIYYEFRAAEEILAEGPWDRAWIDRRLSLMPLALLRHQQAFPAAPQFDWKIEPVFRPQVSDLAEVELKVPHLQHTPGAYCSAGSVK